MRTSRRLNRFVCAVISVGLLFSTAASHAQLFVVPESTVPAGGAGPAHVFKVGKFEITNQQFAYFLNNAQVDAGVSGRGSNLVFQANGQVTTTDGTMMFKPFSSSRIVFVSSSPVGMKYTPEAGYSTHPIMHVSWIGALKFCNWLTIDQEIGEDQRVYTEGPTAADWHPVVISTEDWAVRDLNDAERQDLIENYLGYRLPMDNVGESFGWVGQQENPYNEWYKMAAYDPNAPNSVRSGPADETVSADHWFYGFGRDTITGNGANYLMSGDPFEFGGTTPTGYYNGSNGNTINTSNPYQIHDLSGNVAEWMQDQALSTANHPIRGGSWGQMTTFLASTYRLYAATDFTSSEIGFRVVRMLPAPPMPNGDYNNDGLVNLVDYHEMNTCLHGPEAPYDIDGVTMKTVNVGSGFSFTPANTTIEVGDTVRWDWVGGTHNVSSGSGGIHDGNFYSGPATGNTSNFMDVVFNEDFVNSHPMSNDNYPFYCEPHFGFGMMGSIHVNADPCFPFDFDSDDDVDLADFVAMQTVFGNQ